MTIAQSTTEYTCVNYQFPAVQDDTTSKETHERPGVGNETPTPKNPHYAIALAISNILDRTRKLETKR
jgi:hypothetical protein